MSESELATLDTYRSTSTGDPSESHSVNSDGQSHIIVSDCEAEDDAEQVPSKPGDPIFITQKAQTTAATTNSEQVNSQSHHPTPIQQLENGVRENDFATVEKLATPETVNYGALHHASACNHWRICELLISRGADVNLKLAPQMATPILWACSNGHAYIVNLLVSSGAQIDVADENGFTPLHLAVHSSNVLMVAYIIHLEVDIDSPDVGNRTPLHWAVVQGDHLSVEALLKAGASPNLSDGEGTLPLYHAVYTSKSDMIVGLLLQYGADPAPLLGAGAIDVSNPIWVDGCLNVGKTVNGLPNRSYWMSPELAKVVTAVAPSFVLPLALSMTYLTGTWVLGVPLGALVVYAAKRLLEHFVIPYCWYGKKAVMQSTLLAGVFCSVLLWDSYLWFHKIFPYMITRRPLSTMSLVILLFVLVWAFVTTCTLDPGKIEPKSTAQRLKVMNDLMERGLFDSVHLCLHTYVQIPARARYDYYLERVVCRYDHYCPWMYNAIGVRNHRPFVLFLLSLAVAIVIVAVQYAEYSQEFGVGAFGVGLAILTGLQAVWLYILVVVQCIQISRGTTSFEVGAMDLLDMHRTDPIKAYSSLPKDHPRAAGILHFEPGSSAALLRHNHHGCRSHGKQPLLLRLTGISQCMLVWKGVKHRSRVDNGFTRNCADFWCTGENIWRPKGAGGKIGGSKVDYYTLPELPQRARTESDRMLV